MILRVIICFLILCSAAYADDVTYYFDTLAVNPYTPPENPENLVDGSLLTYAEFDNGVDSSRLQGTTWIGTSLGEITAVSIRTYCEPGLISYVFFMDRIVGSYLDEGAGTCGEEGSPDWTEYYEITPGSLTWAWSDMETLLVSISPNGYTSKFYKVELKVTYTPPDICGVNIN